MSDPAVAVAIERVRAVLDRRPQTGLHDDAPATASWQSATLVASTHLNGTRVLTDMPVELGGEGRHVTPGWLFRAGLASCAATSIAMKAATAGISLTRLDVRVCSRSDTRGLLGMRDAAGQAVSAAPQEIQMTIRIQATGVSDDDLRRLATDGVACAPISGAVQCAVPYELTIETVDP